ncbi:MAG: glycosyltransferase family 39 protein [Anaerolineae bacterium]
MKRILHSPLLGWVILLGGFALRLYHLGLDSLWYDETVSVVLAQNDLIELTRHTAADIHPPLYYYLLHFWGQVAGWSEFATEFLSLWFGVLLIACIYRVTRDLFKARGAATLPPLAALLVAFSPYNVWYSQEVRMYTIGAVLGLASVYFLWRIVVPNRSGRWEWLAYVLVTTAGIYTLYYFVFLIAFEYLAVAVYWVSRRRSSVAGLPYRSLIASQFAIALLYLPWLPIAFRQATDPPVPPWRSFTPLLDVLHSALSALVLGESVDPAEIAPILILALAFIGYLFIRLLFSRRESASRERAGNVGMAAALAGYTLVPLLMIYLASLHAPLYHPRYIFTYSPAFYILLALALDTFVRDLAGPRVWVRLAAAALLVGAAALAFGYSLEHFWNDPQYADDDLRGAVQHIAENWRPGDVVLVDAGYAYTAVLYYYPGPVSGRARLTTFSSAAGDALRAPFLLQTGTIDGSPRLGWGDPRSDFYPTTVDETRAALDRVFQSYSRIWLLRIYDTVTDSQGVIRQYLSAHGQLIDDQGYSGGANLRVQGYLTQTLRSLPQDATPVQANLAGRVVLLGDRGLAPNARGGDNLDLTLYWQPLQSLNYNYQLSVQVLDAGNQVVAQHDETPLGDALPTTRWKAGEIYPEPVRLPLPAGLPAGQYTVIAKLYRLENLEVLGAPVQLGQFAVGP